MNPTLCTCCGLPFFNCRSVPPPPNAGPPKPPPPMPTPGTPEWVEWHLAHSLNAEQAAVCRRLIAEGLTPYPSAYRARQAYCCAVFTACWPGWVARLVWMLIDASVKPLEDDIPF